MIHNFSERRKEVGKVPQPIDRTGTGLEPTDSDHSQCFFPGELSTGKTVQWVSPNKSVLGLSETELTGFLGSLLLFYILHVTCSVFEKVFIHVNSASLLTKHTECSDVHSTLARQVQAVGWNSVMATRSVSCSLELVLFLIYTSQYK